jgi:hypothetical protein
MGRKLFGLARNNFKEAESAFLIKGAKGLSKLPLWTKIGAPVIEAKELFNNYTREKMALLSRIRIDSNENENVMAAFLNPAQNFHGFTAKQAAKAKKTRALMFQVLEETAGFDRAQSENFLRHLVTLRGLGDDINRFHPNNMMPKEFEPFLKDILNGEIKATQNSPFAFMTNLIYMGGRRKYLNTAMGEARSAWKKILADGTIAKEDKDIAGELVRTFLNNAYESTDSTAVFAADLIGGVLKTLRSYGAPIKKTDIDPETIARFAMNMSSWYSGMALAARPALVARNMTQVLLPAVKVGYDRLVPALKKVYGKDRNLHIREALDDLNIPQTGEQGVSGLLAGGDVGARARPGLLFRLGRGLQEAQRQGLRPYRWADRVNNRATTYWMGRDSVELHGKELVAGRINWEQFMFRTGLKGSSPLDQAKMRALLLEGEHAQITKAAREYGKTLVRDTQFIYNSANAPMVFRGTVGRMAGQFGTWPIGFTEFMVQNMKAGGDMAYRKQFLQRYMMQRGAFVGLGMATGIDTSSYNFANPLTFQGGPWVQLFRDVSILGTSTNEFDRRRAGSSVRKAVGMYGTPFMSGTINPFGGAATDHVQARGEEDWLSALMLSLGFNLRSNKPATSR